MLSEVDEHHRATVDMNARKRIRECRAAEGAFHGRGKKRQRPEGVTVAKREVTNYRQKMEKLLAKLRNISPFSTDDAQVQAIAYADFQQRKYEIEYNLKFEWMTRDSWGAVDLF